MEDLKDWAKTYLKWMTPFTGDIALHKDVNRIIETYDHKIGHRIMEASCYLAKYSTFFMIIKAGKNLCDKVLN